MSKIKLINTKRWGGSEATRPQVLLEGVEW